MLANMLNLDNRSSVLKNQEKNAVLYSVSALAKQLKQSWAEAKKTVFPSDYKKVQNAVICGMGGSRFPAIIVKELFKTELKVPIIINDDYQLPSFVNKNSLIILSSYSGTTEEVVTMAKSALNKKAKITAITAGGKIADFIKNKGFPGYLFTPKHNPSGQPRIGFGYGVGGLLGMFFGLNLLKINSLSIDKAIKGLDLIMRNFSVDVPTKTNPAKQIAQKLYQKYPYYIVSEFLTGVGNAIANQTNETAKSISSFRVIPELNHHLMEGLKHPNTFSRIALFLFFFSSLYSPPVKKRFLITKEIVEQNKIETAWYELRGKNKIEQVFELMGLGSFFTMYLASLYQENPASIPYVDYFKKRLKEKE